MREENSTQEISRKTRELYTLRKKIHIYWKKLIAISFKVAKEKGIETIVIGDYEDQIDNTLTNPQAVQVYRNGELVNANELIELSKDINPSLYRKYHGNLKEYNLGILELEKLVKEANDILNKQR